MIIIPKGLPAKEILANEHLNIIEDSNFKEDLTNCLKIVILNHMPLKISNELQYVRILSHSAQNVQLELMNIGEHVSKNTSKEHIDAFYKSFDTLKNNQYDGMIITGAPVELFNFEEVSYWNKLKEIFDWTKTNVKSTLFICWGAQAALYHFHGIPKYILHEKMFGVFNHSIAKNTPLFNNISPSYLVPHSRHTEIKAEDISIHKELEIVCQSKEAGVHIVIENNGKQIYATGHSEYDTNTLKDEYFRDLNKDLNISIPKHYFQDNNSSKEPINTWRQEATIVFTNWIDNYVGK